MTSGGPEPGRSSCRARQHGYLMEDRTLDSLNYQLGDPVPAG
jgi:hypothetical protein